MKFKTAVYFPRALFALATMFLCAQAQVYCADSLSLVSPNKKVEARVTVEAERVSYSLNFQGNVVLTDSALGMTFKDVTLQPLVVQGVTTETHNDVWNYNYGKNHEQVDSYNQMRLSLREQNDAKRGYDIILRAYDDAFAFRYAVPEDSGLANSDGEFVVTDDNSQFNFQSHDLTAWASFYPAYNTSQEETFKRVKLSDIKDDSFVGMPLLVETPQWTVAITEADLLNWSGAQFATAKDSPQTVVLRLTPRNDGNGAVIRKEPAQSPWRVILLGKTPVDMVNASYEILNLATPTLIDDVSWIQPGACAWDWWAPKANRPVTTERFKQFVDFAQERGWPYLLVDAGWAKRDLFGKNATDAELFNKNMDVPALVKYGKEHNVGILLWFHCDDLKKEGEQKLLQRCADWGVKGVKIDFMDSHAQEMVNWTTQTCRIAAQLHLLVDYHGMYKPTGMERTYPNQITREGVKGNEYNRWGRQPAMHTATLPFTRCMLGPADYTPGGFVNRHGEQFQSVGKIDDPNATCQTIGTRAHELALCMVYDSPLRCYCDLPEVYKDQPGLDYLERLPCVWKQTRALQGQIAQFYMVLRKSYNDEFYVSAITDEQARELELKLDFLPEGQTWSATIYADSDLSETDATAVAITTQEVNSTDSLKIKMVKEGGWNAVFTPIKR
ncbi:MAG: glycoside hydrolase family 97 catalytic domain-containing protein [Planctomycetia bacterium]|nr:glycoside hydrolase family 97 catalytic domain-containing protein [Planctomycetia bacterium]